MNANGTQNKTYFSISEVCARTELEPHVLRYWETEFPQLRPKKNRAGNRAYREKDIELIAYIKYLLYKEKFTIPGAKKKLSESNEYEVPIEEPTKSLPETTMIPVQSPRPAAIKTTIDELRDVLVFLKS